MEQYMPLIWIAFAVIMLVCEALTVQLVSIWFVIGAAAAAVVTLFTPSILIQSVVFVCVSLVCLIVTKPLVKRFKKRNVKISTNADRLIGKTGIMLSDIDDNDTVGRVKVEGQVWSAKTLSAPLKKDFKVKILAVEGVKLLVEPQTEE